MEVVGRPWGSYLEPLIKRFNPRNGGVLKVARNLPAAGELALILHALRMGLNILGVQCTTAIRIPMNTVLYA